MPEIRQFTRTSVPQAMTISGDMLLNQVGERQLLQTNIEGRRQEEEIQARKDKSAYLSQLADLELENAKRKQELLTQDFKGDLSDEFANDFEKRTSALQVPPSMREQFEYDRKRMRNDFAEFGIKEQARRAGVIAQTNWENTVDKAINLVTLDSNNEQLANGLITQQVLALPNMPSADRKALLDSAKDKLQSAKAMVTLKNNPEAFIADAKAGKYATLPNLDKYLDGAEKQIEFNQKKAENAIKEDQQIFESNVDLDLNKANNMTDVSVIEYSILENADKYGELNTNQMLMKVENKKQKLLEDQDLMSSGSLFASGEATINPTNDKQKKAFDTYYRNTVNSAQFAQLDSTQKNMYIVDMVSNARYVPDTLRGDIASASMSVNEDAVKNAAELIAVVEEQQPHLLPLFGNEEKIERLSMIKDRINLGYKPKEAISIVDNILNPMNKVTSTQVAQEIKDQGIDFRTKVIDNFNPWLGGVETDIAMSADTIDKATADYRIAFEDNYRRTRNVADADRAAQKAMYKYGRSEINPEPIITSYPIERYYNIGGKFEWIKEQAVSDAIANNPSLNKEELNSNIYIIADPIATRATVNTGKPIYKLMMIKDGVPVDLLNGKYFAPDEESARKQLIEKAKNTNTVKEAVDWFVKH